MARKKAQAGGEQAPAPAGHNKAPLSREDRDALLVHHIGLLRAQAKQVELLREPFKAAQEDFTALVNGAKADLGKGYTRKRLMVLLEDVSTRLRDLLQEEEQRARDRVALGLPVYGQQADLFGDERTPQAARDLMTTEADGYLSGRRGDDPSPPKDVPGGDFTQAWMKGYHEGQRVIAEQMAKGKAVAAGRGQPDADAAPVDLSDQRDLVDA